jgi:hypothetical protein
MVKNQTTNRSMFLEFVESISSDITNFKNDNDLAEHEAALKKYEARQAKSLV